MVTIVEFGDFQCPFCARVEPTIEALRHQYAGKVRVAFRQLPLDFHTHAARAAEAALAAHAQGKFWEMHDRLYQLSANLNDESVRAAAGELGLDLAEFDRAMAAHTYAQAVVDDRKHAAEVGAVVTPTFFINGRLVNGLQPLESLEKIIDEELKVVDAMIAAGTPEDKVYDVRLAVAPVGKPEDLRPKHAQATDPQKALVAKWTPLRGPALAKVTIVEYGDFQCPFCARAQETLAALQKEYGNDLRIAYRHNPLPFHAHARELAEVAMAAAEQGKFWEMHDYIYAHQRQLDEQKYEDFAREVGLDLARYRKSMLAHAHSDQLDADIAEAVKVSARGTPTFFVNGRVVTGAQPIEVFRTAIDAERARAQVLLDRGVALKDLYERLIGDLPSAQP